MLRRAHKVIPRGLCITLYNAMIGTLVIRLIENTWISYIDVPPVLLIEEHKAVSQS